MQSRGGGSGGAVISGGSMSTLSREENIMVMSSEESSSYPDESDLELGLGLSLGGGKAKNKLPLPPPPAATGGSWDQYARILTAKDFPSVVSTKASSSSSSSSSSVTKATNNGSCGTKRTAEPPLRLQAVLRLVHIKSCFDQCCYLFFVFFLVVENRQVVGWPPIRTYRMNSLVNHAKSPVTEDFFSSADKCESKNIIVDKTNHGGNVNNNVAKEKRCLKASLFVKVNMDGIPIGRKVDLNAHSCYKTLAHALDDMFRPCAAVGTKRPGTHERNRIQSTGPM
ncbi:UNVERIFIED_CONTAM: Auxin-responsive protein IAA11 [Sesamum angustifolium]|uniref:Auxin-responsive protein n=1 Tax=Sesamum angustifolium TaxID=2727405 RepID=A0AAW2IY19_9LAMI